MEQSLPSWLRWARELQALNQTGLAYCDNVHDRERYERLRHIAAEIIAAHTHLPSPAIIDHFTLQSGYATPKVGVRGAVIRDEKILLVQEKADARWCLPGGWADVGEPPSTMVVREVFEESGLHVSARKLIAVNQGTSAPQHAVQFYHLYRLIFLCDITGGAPTAGDETLAVDFFAFDDLPPLSTNRTDQHQLREVKAHLLDPARPTAFD